MKFFYQDYPSFNSWVRHCLSVLAIVGIGLGSGLLSLVLSFSAVCLWLRATNRTATTPGEEGKISQLMPDY